MAAPYEDQQWDRLVGALNTWTSAVAVGRAGIRVVLAVEGEQREVHIVMSPDDWCEIWGTAYGDFEQAVADVRRVLQDVPAEFGFLVYHSYELHQSASATLPVDPDALRLREMLLQQPDGIPGGNWVAYTSDGVAHPFPEQPPSR